MLGLGLYIVRLLPQLADTNLSVQISIATLAELCNNNNTMSAKARWPMRRDEKGAHVLAIAPIVYPRTTFESIDFGWSF
jgi:hypothetical protein